MLTQPTANLEFFGNYIIFRRKSKVQTFFFMFLWLSKDSFLYPP